MDCGGKGVLVEGTGLGSGGQGRSSRERSGKTGAVHQSSVVRSAW